MILNRKASRSVSAAAIGRALAGRLLRALDEQYVVRALRGMQAKASAPSTGNRSHAARAVLRSARLQAVGNWVRDQCADVLAKLVKDLAGRTQEMDGEQDLFGWADKEVPLAYGKMLDIVRGHARELTDAVAAQSRELLAEHHGVEAGHAATGHVLRSPVLGATLEEHFDKMAADTLFRFKAAVRAGLKAGDTPERIAERVEGTPESVSAAEPSLAEKAATEAARKRLQVEVGLMDPAENSLAKVVQAAIHLFGNEAGYAAGGEMGDEDKEDMGWQWVAVLDQATCEQCEFYDGRRWDADFEPVGDDGMAFPDDPPLHFNCRCSLVPSDLSEEPAKEMDFEDYLSQFSREEQEQAFGKFNLRAYHRGDITAAQLVGQKDNLMTLEAFKEAGA